MSRFYINHKYKNIFLYMQAIIVFLTLLPSYLLNPENPAIFFANFFSRPAGVIHKS